MQNHFSVFQLVTFCALWTTSICYAATPFDGKWKGVGKSTAECADKAELAFTVKDGEFVQFYLIGPRGSATSAKGLINESGSVTIEYGSRRLKGNLAFSGDTFQGKLDTFCGMRDFAGQRE